ncbi:MAG: SURF1 family cytochrome oxidase biogenesis protein, partial [Pseudomonadota bacterium]
SGEAVGPAWHVYAPLGSIQWQPFRQVVFEGERALVGFQTFDDRIKDDVSLPNVSGPRAGYVRRIRPQGRFADWFVADDNPALNRWFSVNPDGAWVRGINVYIELDPTETDANALPIRRPDIANNHVSYMLTWWSFAIILLIIYTILHRRAGRLSWS